MKFGRFIERVYEKAQTQFGLSKEEVAASDLHLIDMAGFEMDKEEPHFSVERVGKALVILC